VTSPKCFETEALCLRMRRSGTLKLGLRPCLRTNYGPNGSAKQENRGTSMRPISRVQGKWCYLYRAIDHDGNLVDSRLSEKRDMEAAKQFFKQAIVVGHAPESVTTDGHRSYPRAVRETLGHEVVHRTNVYLNNRIEQDHRGIKQRYYPMRGFGSFASAARFCRAFDEIRQFFRVRISREQKVSLAQKREVFRQQLDALKTLVSVAM
jgi:putative transposase